MLDDHKQKNQGHWHRMADCGTPWRGAAPDDLLIGLDDTDNLDSPGTGFRARELARLLHEQGLGQPQGITRHQLLVDPRIPYTSHNSSACLCVRQVVDTAGLTRLCRDYLLDASAPGSDTGLCITRRAAVPTSVQHWGRQAKAVVLHLADARALAQAEGLHLEGLTGTRGGMIGALAAVGLHSSGQDGRFLWVKGLREAAGRTLTVAELATGLHVRPAPTASGPAPQAHEHVALGEWPRAILHHHLPTLLLEPTHETAGPEWRVVAKEHLKRF